MRVTALSLDCDGDTILVRVAPNGPACHLGTTTCFSEPVSVGVGQLALLERTIVERAKAKPDESWTARLIEAGPKRIAQKVGEEGVECALAGAAGGVDELHEEMADLFYHCAVLLHARGSTLDAVMNVLARRAETGK